MPKRSKIDKNEGKRFGRPDLERIGIFSEPSYITSNDPYVPPQGKTKDNLNICLVNGFCKDRVKGKQLLTNPPKKGHQAFFSKEFVRIFQVRLTVIDYDRMKPFLISY